MFATTLVLWIATVLFLAPLNHASFGLPRTLSVLGNPVLALFFGGFVLAIAGSKFGIDTTIADWMVRLSFGRRRALLFTVMTGTAILSMWNSNIAAAAMTPANAMAYGEGELHSSDFLLIGVATMLIGCADAAVAMSQLFVKSFANSATNFSSGWLIM